MKQWLGRSVLMLCALTFSNCNVSKPKRPPNTLVVSLSDDVRTLDPALAYDAISVPLVASIYSTLFQYDYFKRPYVLQPLLAADQPTWSKDRKTLTVRIRSDVSFQNGKPLVAADFVYAFKRLAWPALASEGTWIFDGKIKGYREFMKKLAQAKGGFKQQLFETPIEGFETPDDQTLVFHLTRPYPQFLHVLAMPFTAPMDRTWVESHANPEGQLVDVAMGTGPFVLESWRRGHQVVLKRNPKYFVDTFPMVGPDAGKILPFVDGVIAEVVKESQPAWLRFSKGEFDISRIPKDSFDLVFESPKPGQPYALRSEVQQKGWKLHQDPGKGYFFLSFNVKDPTVGMSNPNAKFLRRAISHAIDREEFIRLFTNGRGEPMRHIVPPGIEGRPSNPAIRYDFQLEKAKSALAAAGYPGGKGLAPLTLDMRSADSDTRQMAEFMTKSLAAIGITLKIQFNTFPAYLEKTNRMQFQMIFDGWLLDYPDAENAVQLVSGQNKVPGPNKTGIDLPKLNSLVESVSELTPGPARNRAIEAIDQMVQEESIWVYLFHRTQFVLAQPWIWNYLPDETMMNRFKYLRVTPVRP